ncbi:MAG: hypothetical protein IJU45_03240, partial [Clostridia bacterium]|nr:hypothetical protein [Clostridia bacterium]
LEEARFALKMMEKCSLNSQEAIESIVGYVERIRKIRLAELVEYIINTKLTPMQKSIIEDFWFKGIAPEKTARRLGVSLSAVYSAKTKAQLIIRDYLEPLVMYLKDISDCDTAPVTEMCLKMLRAKKESDNRIGDSLKNIRLCGAVEAALLSKALGISETELNTIENGNKEITTALLEKYSRIFKINIYLQCSDGEWRLKWTDR